MKELAILWEQKANSNQRSAVSKNFFTAMSAQDAKDQS
jgi:hypothetical protein